MMLNFWKKCLIVSVSSVPFALLCASAILFRTEADLSWYPPRDSWQTGTKTIPSSLHASSVCLHLLLNAVMRVCPGFDAEDVSLAGVSGWTIVTSRAHGFPAKFGIMTSAGFELFDWIKAASSFLGVRFTLLATSKMALWMWLCLEKISPCLTLQWRIKSHTKFNVFQISELCRELYLNHKTLKNVI